MRDHGLTRRQFLERTSIGLAAASVAPKAPAVADNPNVLALHGGTPVRTKAFPSWPQANAADEANVVKAVRNHRWCTMDGEFIPKFEKAWAATVGVKGCVSTPCGTHALHMALELLGIGPGDEVLVSPYTFVATIDSITMAYALPVFVDTDIRTFQMDPDDIEHRITEKTRAIMPVHVFGASAHMDKILAIAEKHDLPVIEDACQGHLAEWRGKRLGSLGTIGCFSFQETKNLPGGEAGALVSNREDLIAKARMFRNFGRDPKKPGTYAIRATKYRISDFAPAVLMAQMERLEEVSALREKNAAYLREEIKKISGLMPQEHYPESTRQNYYIFGFRYDKAQFKGASQQKIVEALAAEGIPTDVGYSALYREAFLEDNLHSRGYRAIYGQKRLDRYRKENRYPHNDELCATSLFFEQPVLIGSKSDVDDIVEALAKVQRNAAAL